VERDFEVIIWQRKIESSMSFDSRNSSEKIIRSSEEFEDHLRIKMVYKLVILPWRVATLSIVAG
jgi:hypothetical protein